MDNLPFFMKPGIKHINSGNIKFDNDSRIVGRTTTKKSGIGLTANFVYIDEFAHIDSAKLDEFYRAIFPTISADPNAKIVITSTPNGKNKFYEIWTDAIAGKSSFVPLRVDWWQVPGRDEAWKEATIADIGSIEDFNQEYGLQFFSSDQLLLNSIDLKRLYNIKTEYLNTSFDLDEDRRYINDFFYFHPKYAKRSIDEFRSDPANYVFSIDTADGVGGDYSVLNIYKVATLPVSELLKKKDTVRNEIDTIALAQVGTFRTNQLDVLQFAAAVDYITYQIFNPERVRIVLEMNYKGEIIHSRMADNPKYWTGQFIHTKHTEMATNPKLGLRLGPTNKIKYCEQFKHLITTNRVIPNDFTTVMELMAFGKSKGGVYRGQSGNDDLAMTSVNLAPFFDSSQFWDIAIDTYENSSAQYRKEIEEKIFAIHRASGSRQAYDYDTLRELNLPKPGETGNSKIHQNVFDVESLIHMQKIKSKFFKE